MVLIDLTRGIAAVSTLSVPGNGNAGFGGAVGQGNMALDSNTAGDVRITFTRGPGEVFDLMVLYVDAIPGGEPSTDQYTDQGDASRVAISGISGSNRARLTFPDPMRPDFAIAYSPNFGGYLFRLTTNGSHQHSATVAATSTSSSVTNDFNFNLGQIGLSAGDAFDFFVTYLSDTAYRSDEYLGPLVTSGNTGYSPVTLPAGQRVTFVSVPNPCAPDVCFFSDGFEAEQAASPLGMSP